jgi:arylsulfatase A-like enzyme
VLSLLLAEALEAAQENGQDHYNVVLIVINALGADHLGCYGYLRNTSPNIDRLAQDAIAFNRAISQSYWTLPSLSTIFTSRYPAAHGVTSRDTRLDEVEMTLAEILKAQGYKTAAFSGGFDTERIYGLDQGFQTYDAYSGKRPMGTFADVMPRALRWLNENKGEKFFLFLHAYDVHSPYVRSAKNSFGYYYKGILEDVSLDYSTLKRIRNHVLNLDKRQIHLTRDDIDYIIACYDDGIRRMDKYVGQLLGKLRHLQLYDKTVIILTSDHGEELGRGGSFDRFGNQNLYQEVIRIPLIIRYPPLQIRGRRILSLAGLVDIMPTVLDLLDINRPASLQGRSLAALIKGDKDAVGRRYIVSEASNQKWAILRGDGWKLIYAPQAVELYNINDDPLEEHNLIDQRLDIQVSLMKEFFLWRQHHRDQRLRDKRIEIDLQLLERLRKAGYW